MKNALLFPKSPGTTRDTIEEILNIDGIQFRLIDTAGIREAQDQIEAVGVEKTFEKVSQAALLIYVFDVSEMKIDEVLEDVFKLQNDNIHLIIVCNKMDKNPYFKPEWLTNPADPEIDDFYFKNRLNSNSKFKIHHSSLISVSALNKMNIPYLKEKLHQAVLSQKVNLDNTIVTNIRHLKPFKKRMTVWMTF